MSEEKKRVASFPGRRSEIAKAVASVITTNQPTIGGTQGEFARPPCGTCFSWRRDKRAGTQGVPLNAGQCFFGPPTPHPVMTDAGVMVGAVAIRPPMASDSEGCDQHDDGTDEDGDGEEQSLLARAG